MPCALFPADFVLAAQAVDLELAEGLKGFSSNTCNDGLGSYPVVTLAKAREKALRNARLLSEGKDPRHIQETAIPTFLDASERVLALQSWKNQDREEKDWRSLISRHCEPIINLPVDVITSMQILTFLQPVWMEKRSVGRVLKNRLDMIFAWTIANGYRTDNPMEPLSSVLPRNGVHTRNHEALPYADIPAAIAKIRDLSNEPVRLALEFTILTAARSGEVRGADWSEIDFGENVWTLPASRMKAGREHRVPLSPRCVAILERMREYNEHSHLIFASSRSGDILANSTLSKAVRKLGLGTPHGFRSSFRDWCAETGKSRDLAEHSLAHVVGGVEGAYFRSDLLEQRRELMEQWSEHCTG